MSGHTKGHVLVTGGAGYIGSHACLALHQAGYTPVVFDNFSTGSHDNLLNHPYITGDIRDATAITTALTQVNPVAVMHFAAKLAVGESVQQPADYYETNSLGAFNVLGAMRTTLPQPVPFIFSSTAAVYGIPDGLKPITEQSFTQPINPYGHSKRMVEIMLADYAAAYQQPSVTLRYFNAVGADPGGELGFRQQGAPYLMPAIFEAMLGLRPALTIHGTDYPTPDGTPIRDYIHVTDLANAHVRALEWALYGGQPAQAHIFNLGTGRGHSVREIISAVEAETGRTVPCMEKDRRPGDPPVLVADASCARAQLHWQPHHSSLSSIVQTAWRWHQRVFAAPSA